MLIIQRPEIESEEQDGNVQRFSIAPLEPGFGHTLGTRLRAHPHQDRLGRLEHALLAPRESTAQREAEGDRLDRGDARHSSQRATVLATASGSCVAVSTTR